MEIELGLNDIRMDIDFKEINAGTKREVTIKFINSTPYTFIVKELMLSDPEGYIRLLNFPREIEGKSSGDIIVEVNIPKDIIAPLKGNTKLKGNFVIK